jgi:hypothetical protein
MLQPVVLTSFLRQNRGSAALDTPGTKVMQVDCALRRAPLHPLPSVFKSEANMRAEVERLVEEIEQSVGLLRRHL